MADIKEQVKRDESNPDGEEDEEELEIGQRNAEGVKVYEERKNYERDESIPEGKEDEEEPAIGQSNVEVGKNDERDESNPEEKEDEEEPAIGQSNADGVDVYEEGKNDQELKSSSEVHENSEASDKQTAKQEAPAIIDHEQQLEENTVDSSDLRDTPKVPEDQSVKDNAPEISKDPEADVPEIKEKESSVVETAKPGDVFSKNESATIHQPLSLSWSFGYNSALPVHNISYSDKRLIFYACNQTGILYDCHEHKQHLLQGHGNPITCTAVSSERRWLVTADVGLSPLLIVWDSYSAIPVRTFFDNLGQGTIAVGVSHDSKYLATLGIQMPQTVSIWDWTNERDTPLHTIGLPLEHGIQMCISFNQKDSSLLVSNSEESVVFYKWDHKRLHSHCTPLTDKEFNKSIGYLSQSVFVPGNRDLALTATSEGYGVVWETTGIHRDNVDLSTLPLYHKTPIKLMVLHNLPISTITTDHQYIVTGDMGGKVKFHDAQLTLVNWYDQINCGPVVSISFAFETNLAKQQARSSQYPSQSTLEAEPFVAPNFILSSATSSVVHITANGTIQDVILKESDSSIQCISAHPLESRLVIASSNGILKLWDYQNKVVVSNRSFSSENGLTNVQFDSQGEFIGIGFTDGEVRVLCGLTLEDRSQPFSYSKDSVTHIAFSQESLYMASADSDQAVTVFALSSPSVAKGGEMQKSWTFLARHRAHYKKIQSLEFGVFPDSGKPRLLSLSEDRHLVEYDLANSTEDDLRLLSVDRIEQSAVPLAMTWYPPLSKESFLLTVNDQYKLKLYNSTTKMCRKTLLGPTFGSPLKKLIVLPGQIGYSQSGEEARRYLAYITRDKVGLLLLPHNGNPHNSMCLMAHSGQVTDLASSCDGQFLFTAGGDDCTVNMWRINTTALELSSELGGPELEPFYSLIDGGREGPFFAELEEFFYYAQIRSQGPDTMDTRQESLRIQIDQIPFVMRAIGFYPSEQEIENMLNEVRFSRYVDSGTYVTDIDLGDFIKMYINHRPVYGLAPRQFAAAFKCLGGLDFETKEWKIDRSQLLSSLQERGEHLTEAELVEHLMSLLGCCNNPEKEGDYNDSPENVLFTDIPKLISAKEFVEEIVGLST